jgi:hypothetical protein
MPIPGSISGFGVSNVKIHSPPRLAILRIPMRSLRISGFRDSSCREFLVTENPEMPNPDLFRILGHASLRLTVMIASGNRGSRFLYARVSCLWKTRCSKCRLAQISCHASYQDQRLRSFSRDFATYPVPCLLSSEIPISRCVKCRWRLISNTCPSDGRSRSYRCFET